MDSRKGSPTNASDAMDDIELPSKPTTEEKVDAAVKETFPASDPTSPAAGPVSTRQPQQPPKRSPDWMFEKKS